MVDSSSFENLMDLGTQTSNTNLAINSPNNKNKNTVNNGWKYDIIDDLMNR